MSIIQGGNSSLSGRCSPIFQTITATNTLVSPQPQIRLTISTTVTVNPLEDAKSNFSPSNTTPGSTESPRSVLGRMSNNTNSENSVPSTSSAYNEEEELKQLNKLESEIEFLQNELVSLKLHLSLISIQSSMNAKHLQEEGWQEVQEREKVQRKGMLGALRKQLEMQHACTLLSTEMERQRNDELEENLNKPKRKINEARRRRRVHAFISPSSSFNSSSNYSSQSSNWNSLPSSAVSSSSFTAGDPMAPLMEKAFKEQQSTKLKSQILNSSELSSLKESAFDHLNQREEEGEEEIGDEMDDEIKLEKDFMFLEGGIIIDAINTEEFPKPILREVRNEPSFSGTPVELSAEMVRIMCSIYRRQAESSVPHARSSSDPIISSQVKNVSSPSMSRKSVNLKKAGSLTSAEVDSDQTWREMMDSLLKESRMDYSEPMELDPYGTRTFGSYDSIGEYGHYIEIKQLPDERDPLSIDAAALCKYKDLVDQLMDIDPRRLNHDERLAFWINLYNAIYMHTYLAFGVPQSHSKRINLMLKVTYMIGGLQFNLFSIEHKILRAHTSSSGLSGSFPNFKTRLSTDSNQYKASDERSLCVLTHPEPLVSFALCTGTFSAPGLRVYSSEDIHAELQNAAKDYLQAAISVCDNNDKILLPQLLQWYSKDLASDSFGLVEWVAKLLPKKQKTSLLFRLPDKRSKVSKVLYTSPYDWSFRYLLPSKML